MRKSVAIVVVLALAVIGVAIGVITVRNASRDDSSTASESTSDSTSSSTGSGSKASSSSSTKKTSKSTTGSGSSSTTSKVLSDPSEASFDLSAFAIGDWGATTYSKNGSCCSRRSDYYYNAFDRHAEQGVSELMAQTAAVKKPEVVLGHGDNFYWTGIMGSTDQAYRFEKTFESKYADDALVEVPWVNVMGNHDYGGGSYVCSDGTDPAQCSSTSKLLEALEEKFSLQSTYTSPNNDRWIMSDHFYVHTISAGDVSIDIFNVDTNDAESHGADQICCQCYGYSEGDDKQCKAATRGHKYCAGGDTDMWDQCMALFKKWGDEAREKLVEEVGKSTATWKIVNSHYSPYNHYGETSADEWAELLKGISGSEGGIQLWINGHTHGEKHDFASFDMHFIENGAGGGIQSEAASGIPAYAESYIESVWVAPGVSDGNTYGFFELSASEEWLKVRFLTFDSNWAITKDDSGYDKGKIGGVEEGHCWFIPVDGTKGEACS